jgi:hypothetical protein
VIAANMELARKKIDFGIDVERVARGVVCKVWERRLNCMASIGSLVGNCCIGGVVGTTWDEIGPGQEVDFNRNDETQTPKS